MLDCMQLFISIGFNSIERVKWQILMNFVN